MSNPDNVSVSAIYYPVGKCDIVVNKLRLKNCNECVFVGTSAWQTVLIKYIIPKHSSFLFNDMVLDFNGR